MTKKLFLDTNIFLRFIVIENQETYNETKSLFSILKEGKLRPYTSNTVISELIYILVKLYKQPKLEVIRKIQILLKMRNLTLLEKTATKSALDLYRDINIKFGDCLIATQIPKGVTLCTYDEDFKKIPGLVIKTPSKIDTSQYNRQ